MERFEDERDRQHRIRVKLLDVGLDVPQPFADRDGDALVKTCENVAGHLVRMVHRQDRESDLAVYIDVLGHVVDVRNDVAVAEHDALGHPRGAGSEQQRCHFFRIDFSIHKTAFAVAQMDAAFVDKVHHRELPFAGLVGVHIDVVLDRLCQRKNLLDGLLHLAGVDERFRLRPVEQVGDLGRLQFTVDRNDHAGAHRDRKVRHDPLVAVLPDDGDALALEAHVHKTRPEVVDILLEFAVGDRLKRFAVFFLH